MVNHHFSPPFRICLFIFVQPPNLQIQVRVWNNPLAMPAPIGFPKFFLYGTPGGSYSYPGFEGTTPNKRKLAAKFGGGVVFGAIWSHGIIDNFQMGLSTYVDLWFISGFSRRRLEQLQRNRLPREILGF